MRMGKGKSGGKVKGGEYLPLSEYEKRGFDVEAIRQKCKDTKKHPILGTLYRIRSTFSKTIEQMVESHEFHHWSADGQTWRELFPINYGTDVDLRMSDLFVFEQF